MKSFFSGRSGKALRADACAPIPSPHQKKRPSSQGTKENADPNQGMSPAEATILRTPSAAGRHPLGPMSRSPLPPRPPPPKHDTPIRKKKKLNLETATENKAPGATAIDSSVQVIVRMRPLNEAESNDQIVQKISADSISVVDRIFTFDSVADSCSTQEDVFRLVGLPLVENCLSGFNSSIFAYGQTGSGKTYTMWGPSRALLEDRSSSAERGLTPRVFEQLLSRINEEEEKHSDKQLTYQCHCSFLEIYNEQIIDLLDPSRRNLQIREDIRSGIYVDCLSEEYVCTVKDVNQLLLKGLANRRTGSTGINTESSRSHCVFTCVVESRSKSVADGLNNLRIRRINLVDLAGSERQKLTGAAGDRLKEAGNINRSLSQLGNLIHILAEVSQSGKQRHIPYRDSKLTFLLQESLGGNAKLAMICAISPSQSYKNETFSTLRFAKCAKAIKNKAVVNEIMQDDVNVLREQIRQLKDELLKMKSGIPTESNGSYSTGWSARRSLNLLKMSLRRPMALPAIDDDSDEEMEIDEDVMMPTMAPCPKSAAENVRGVQKPTQQEVGLHKSFTIEDSISYKKDENHLGANDDKQLILQKADALSCTSLVNEPTQQSFLVQCDIPIECNGVREKSSICSDFHVDEKMSNACNNPCNTSFYQQSPTQRVDIPLQVPKTSMMNQKDIAEDLKPNSEDLNHYSAKSKSSKRKSSLAPTERLVASLFHGIQMIDSHQQKSPVGCSSRFSFRPEDFKRLSQVGMTDVGIQTTPLETEIHEDSLPSLCSKCKNDTSVFDQKFLVDHKEHLLPADGSEARDVPEKQLPKAVENVLAGAFRREMAMEDHLAKQNMEIHQLNRLIQQYKHERECNAMIEQIREEKILRLERLMDGILPTEECMEEEYTSLLKEHRLLKEKYDNHPCIVRKDIELKRVQAELERHMNFIDLGEREVLMEEIQDLRSQMQHYIDHCPLPYHGRTSLFQPINQNESTPIPVVKDLDFVSEHLDEKFVERRKGPEMQSKGISVSEELRQELEESRSIAQKLKVELDSEKKCSEELKEALQTAMKGHTHILDQYADLQEKHMALLARHQQIRDGIENVKEAAVDAGIGDQESKFIDSLAAQVSALRVEREKERLQWKDERKGLQTQLRDTAEALQAAGELLVRLKEAEESAAIAQRRTIEAEKEVKDAQEEIEILRKKHGQDIDKLKQLLSESQTQKEPLECGTDGEAMVKCDGHGSSRQLPNEFEPLYHASVFSRGAEESSWFSGYDQCNM